MTRRQKIEKLIDALDVRDVKQRSEKTIAEVEATLGRFSNGYTQMIKQFIRSRN